MPENKIQEILKGNISITQKIDGLKITVFKVSNGNYIISYKENIIYSGEHTYQTNIENTIGSSQFSKVFGLLNFENDIPDGTEMLMEFTARKPTLSSEYDVLHKLTLISASKSEYDKELVKFGKLLTNPINPIQDILPISKMIGVPMPNELFRGVWGDIEGIKSEALYSALEARGDVLDVDSIKDVLLGIESQYGGLEEGVVVKSLDTGEVFKWQQDYQCDQNARRHIKNQHRGTPDEENEYWVSIKELSQKLVNGISVRDNLEMMLYDLSDMLKQLIISGNIHISHPKRSFNTVLDDIQLTSKNMLIKSISGNNNALIMGKFRVLTKDGHVKMIEHALQNYDNVVIALITSKENKCNRDLRKSMLVDYLGDNERVHIIEHSNGNIRSILGKCKVNINAIVCGEDRKDGYVEQLKNTFGVNVDALERDESDISATKVIENLDDMMYFSDNVPKTVVSYYPKICEAYDG